MEQLYLMSEIENFYPLSAFLRTGLENWIIHHKSPNTMDVLQWAPRDSKVITKYINEMAVGYKWLKWPILSRTSTEQSGKNKKIWIFPTGLEVHLEDMF